MSEIVVIQKSELIKLLKEIVKEQSKENFDNSNEGYLTRKETAKLLKVSLVTLHNWNKSGVLKPHYIGNKVLYKLDEVKQKVENF